MPFLGEGTDGEHAIYTAGQQISQCVSMNRMCEIYQETSFQPSLLETTWKQGLSGKWTTLMAQTRRRFNAMAIYEFASKYRLQTKRDPGDETIVIWGRKGDSHVFEYDEHLLGVLIMPDTQTAHWWNAARAAFDRAGMEIRQDGDAEGTATFDPENAEQVRLALKYADVRRRRKVSVATRERLKLIGFQKPQPEIGPCLQSEFGRTVGAEKTPWKREAAGSACSTSCSKGLDAREPFLRAKARSSGKWTSRATYRTANARRHSEARRRG